MLVRHYWLGLLETGGYVIGVGLVKEGADLIEEDVGLTEEDVGLTEEDVGLTEEDAGLMEEDASLIEEDVVDLTAQKDKVVENRGRTADAEEAGNCCG